MNARIIVVELEALQTGSLEHLAVDVESVEGYEEQKQHWEYYVKGTAEDWGDVYGTHDFREGASLNPYKLEKIVAQWRGYPGAVSIINGRFTERGR